VKERLSYAKKWIEEYAPVEYKFSINTEIPKETREKLRELDISALLNFGKHLSKGSVRTEDQYMEIIRDIIKESGIEPKSFYRAAYLALLNKEHGPKLSSLIKMIVDKETAKILATLSVK